MPKTSPESTEISKRTSPIIWLTVPLAIVGITAGLLSTGGAFDSMSMLGALSPVGLPIKNAIVLIEERVFPSPGIHFAFTLPGYNNPPGKRDTRAWRSWSGTDCAGT